MVDKPKCKDACHVARVAKTSDGRYINRHYKPNPNREPNSSSDASFTTVASALAMSYSGARVEHGDSKRSDFIQGREVDSADV